MLYTLYNWLWRLAHPWLIRKLRHRAISEPLYLHATHQRWARYTETERTQATAHAGQWIWLHAVSLGEMRAARVLVEVIRKHVPHVPWLITQSTATGWAEGATLLREGDMQVWLPWDEAGAVQRFVHTFRPAVGLLMETEIWPNLLAVCQQQAVPVALVNARVNVRTFGRWQRMSALAHQAFGSLAMTCAQTRQDAERLRQLGARHVQVSGNLKFDMQPNATLLAHAQQWRGNMTRPIAMLASSREGEEQLWIEAWQQLYAHMQQADTVQWLIVPRHPQRFDEVADLLQKAGFAVQRRSQWGRALGALSLSSKPSALRDADAATDAEADAGVDTEEGGAVRADAVISAASNRLVGSQPVVWLGDSLGEMPLYYGMASVAIMGGSIAPLGGQNLIEACACGCPVILGAHTFNFAHASEQALAEGAATRCADMADALVQVRHITQHMNTVQADMACAALDFARRHQGAAQRTWQALHKAGLLSSAPSQTD